MTHADYKPMTHHAHHPPPTWLAWIKMPEHALVIAVVVLQLSLLWSFRYFPSTDGATHLANAAILRGYNNPQATEWRKYYVIPGRLDPNLAGHLLLAGFMYVAPPLVAEKLLISLYIVGLPLAFAYALRGVRRDAGRMAILVTPFTFTYVLHMGFYNFSLSIAGFFLVLGCWLRLREKLTWQRAIGFAVLAFGLYMCHLLSLVLAMVAIGVIFAWDVLYAWWTSHLRDKAFWRPWLVRAIVTGAAAAPALALTALFMKRHRDPKIPGNKVELLKQLFSLESLNSFRDVEMWVTRGLSALLLVTAAFILIRKLKTKRVEWFDGLVLLVPAMGLLYLKAGVQVYLPQRLGLYVFLCLALWLAVQHLDAIRWVLIGGCSLIAVAMLALFVPMYGRLNAQLDEYLSAADYIQPNSTLLALPEIRIDKHKGEIGARKGWAPGGSINTSIHTFLYAQAYLVADKRLVDLRNYEADMGYFPVDYRRDMNPYTVLPVPYVEVPLPWKPENPPRPQTSLEWWPAPVDLRAYEAKSTKGSVDYVLLWGKQDEMTGRQAETLFDQLKRDYDLIYTSPNGLAHLYQRKAFLSGY